MNRQVNINLLCECVQVCLYVCMCVYMRVHVCGSQRSTSVFLRSRPSCFFLHLKKFVFIYITCTCECVSGEDVTAAMCGVSALSCAPASVCRGEDVTAAVCGVSALSHIPISLSTCLWETVLSFHHVGSGIEYKALVTIRLGGKCLYPPSHVISPQLVL